MNTIFRADGTEDAADNGLVLAAQGGDQDALESLVKRHQHWIYNIALRMVGRPDDAQDVTQEILIKMITKLSTFQRKSRFRTWLYRMVTNHVINMKRTRLEHRFSSLDHLVDFKDKLETAEFTGVQHASAEKDLLVKETKNYCLTGMLLCLDRTQRVVFILGAILRIDSRLGGEFLEISPENFRKILSRARKQLGNFMNDNCGLINESNSCRCETKTRACIEAGIVDPDKLRFTKEHLFRAEGVVSDMADRVADALEMKVQNTFRDQPLVRSPDFFSSLKTLLNRNDIGRIINFNDNAKRT